jgi:predicted DNA-binding transcriptional regulator YafY
MSVNRNRQMIRTLTLLQLLESRNGRTLDELAADTGVTTRTIRRDLEAIEAAGIPLIDTSVEAVGALNYPISNQRRWKVYNWRKEAA